MPNELSTNQVSKLFSMHSSQDIEAFLESLTGIAPSEWDWHPLGDRLNNAGNVELITEPGPPVVERITNGIDAMLELQYGLTSCPGPGPSSPRAAAEQWFDIQGGTLSAIKEDRTLISKLAPNVVVDVYDSGEPKAPTISIWDAGIGQHPTDLPDTILSLGASNKIGKQYLCGAYGQGGSSSFAWCKYTLIVSRKRPNHADGKPDLVGWTIVRQYDSPELKNYTYQYLVTVNKEIPTFVPFLLDGTKFEFGTYIAHIVYRLGRLAGPWSLVGYRYLDNLLFDPVLPYTIRDHRASPPFNRNMGGARSRLLGASVEYSNEYQANLGPDGSLGIRYWVFKEKRRSEQDDSANDAVSIDSFLEAPGSSRTVIVTLNGQRHGYLDKPFIKQSRYSLLADSLLVQVDCDHLSRQMKKGLFPATRSGLVSGERRLELIESCVREALESDEHLKQIQHERVQRLLATVDEESERKVRRLLEKLISVTKPSESPGARPREGEGQIATGKKRFQPKDPPTYFKFVEENQPLTIEAGGQRVIDVVTDGPDDLLTRNRRRGRLTLEAIGDQFLIIHKGSLHEGRICITITAAQDARIGANCQLHCVLEMEGGVYFPSQRLCEVKPPSPPYQGAEPPTRFEIVTPKGGNVRLRQNRASRVLVRSDCRDDLLSRAQDPGSFEIRCSVLDSFLEARRGPHHGEIEAYFRVPQNTTIETRGSLTARLVLADGIILEDSKPCVVVAPPPTSHEPGRAPERRSNYNIIDVWRQPPPDRPDSKIWDDLGWNETHVGKHELVLDPTDESKELLLLYVNMDNEELSKEKERCLRRLGEISARRLETRYKAYIGYHLWLHFERTRFARAPKISAGDDRNEEARIESATNEEQNLYEEMRRVARTVLLAMRSERDLFATLRAGE